MDAPTRESIRMIRKMAMAYTPGQTSDSTRDGGSKANNMVLDFTMCLTKSSSMDCGKMGRELNGLTLKQLMPL